MKSFAPIIMLLLFAACARADAPATQPASRANRLPPGRRLEMKATIDGSDELHITPNGLTWYHKLWDWPSDVTVNGQPCDPHETTPLEKLDIGLTKQDLCAERVTVIEREARDTLAVEASDDGIIVYFADSQSGSDTYRVVLEFGPAEQKQERNAKGPTTRP